MQVFFILFYLYGGLYFMNDTTNKLKLTNCNEYWYHYYLLFVSVPDVPISINIKYENTMPE